MRHYYSFLIEDTPPSNPSGDSSGTQKPPDKPQNNSQTPVQTGNKSVDAARQKTMDLYKKNAMDKARNNFKTSKAGMVTSGIGGSLIGAGLDAVGGTIGGVAKAGLNVLTGKAFTGDGNIVSNFLDKTVGTVARGAAGGTAFGTAGGAAATMGATHGLNKVAGNLAAKGAGIRADKRMQQHQQNLAARQNRNPKPTTGV